MTSTTQTTINYSCVFDCLPTHVSLLSSYYVWCAFVATNIVKLS